MIAPLSSVLARIMRFFSLPKFRVSDWHMPVGGSDLLGVVEIRANDHLTK
ncbi:hypothetical protein SynA1562_01826 [Synechococcus sp. A15-62]|nr:hypothetical protein SynA1562_01826 [Synechococcus sp. A15-62]